METIPATMVIAVIVLAFILCNSFRKNEFLLLFLFGIAVASIAGIFELYPLTQQWSETPEGGGRLVLLWGAIVALIFSQAITSIASVISGKISMASKIPRRYSFAIYTVFPTAFVVVLLVGIVHNVSKYQDVYRDVLETKPILDFLYPKMEDGDIVIWHPYHKGGARYYLNEESLTALHLFADAEECLGVLESLPENTRRIWIVQPHSPCGYEILAHLYDPDLVVPKQVSPSSRPPLFLVSDAQRAAQHFSRFFRSDYALLSDLSSIVLRTSQYDIYLSERTILYAVPERCEDITVPHRIVLHIFPVDQGDLSNHARESGFVNLDFDFRTFHAGFGEECYAVRFLPGYPVERIWTGDSGGKLAFIYPDASLRAVDIDSGFIASLGSPILEHDHWRIYSSGSHLVFTGPCEHDQNRYPFFLHFYPVEASDLSSERRDHGFESRDFYFSTEAGVVGDACVAVREIADYPIDYIDTGQYDEAERIWEAVVEWEAAGPSPE